MLGQTIKAIKQREAEGSRVENTLAGVYHVDGLFLVSGAGQTNSAVRFPVKFIERPNISFAGELDVNSAAVPGNYPTLSVVVGGWVVEGPPTKRLWTGANLLVVTNGPATQKIWVHWEASARAVSNPYS